MPGLGYPPYPYPVAAPNRFELLTTPNVNSVECSTRLSYGAMLSVVCFLPMVGGIYIITYTYNHLYI